MQEMDKSTREQRPEDAPGPEMRKGLASNRGIALLFALIITLVVFLLVASTLYMITQGTRISGPRKAYKTACEASDGAVEVTKDAIEKAISNLPLPGPNVFPAQFATDLATTVLTNKNTCSTSIIMPGTMGEYTAFVTVTRLFVKGGGGVGTIEFPPRAYGSKANAAIFFRIVTTVKAANGVTCENAVIYRHI